MNKLIEKIVEPYKIIEGSVFKLRIKAIKYVTYNEIKEKSYNFFKSYKYKNLKGE